MRWSNAILLIVLAGLAACSPRKDANLQAKAAPAESKPIGHTPAPMETATSSGPLLFHGYACGSDCAGHWEGYSWASAQNISDPGDCRGTSETFIEGCKAFAGVEGPLGGRYIDQSFPHMIGSD